MVLLVGIIYSMCDPICDVNYCDTQRYES